MRHLTLAAMAVLLLGACSVATSTIPPNATTSVPPGSSISVPPAALALAGRQFWSTAVVGHDLVPGTRVRLTFNPDGSLGAGAGCNLMGGSWSIDGTTLKAQIAQMTEMGCADDRFAQDDWFVGWVANGLTATMQGDELILTGGGVTMTLLDKEVADPDRTLEGTDWILSGLETGVGDDGVVMSVPTGVRATLRVDGGKLTVDTGCNAGGATVTVDNDTLTVGPLGLTKRGCEGDAALVERHITSILQGPVTVAIDGPSLRLLGQTGGLDFTAD